jgi:hypothetical protein
MKAEEYFESREEATRFPEVEPEMHFPVEIDKRKIF